MDNKDMPASPIYNGEGFATDHTNINNDGVSASGLTKLEHFAGLVMQGLMSNNSIDPTEFEVAECSVRHAKALLEELEKA